jgi:hypothetical protein
MSDIHIVDIDLDEIISNNMINVLFNYNDSITYTKCHLQQQNCDNSNLKCYFGNNGLLHNMYQAELCDIQWLAGFYIMNFIYQIIYKIKDISIFNNILNDKINIFTVGNNIGSLLSGIHHFYFNSVFTPIDIDIDADNAETKCKEKFNWCSIIPDYNNLKTRIDKKFYSLYSSNLIDCCHNNELTKSENILFIKQKISEKYDKLHILINDTWYLEYQNKNYNSLLSTLTLIETLDDDGILIIQMPYIYFSSDDIIEKDIILLISMIFKTTRIIKFPVPLSSGTSFQLYIVAVGKKKIYNDKCKIYIKLINGINKNDTKYIKTIFNKKIWDKPHIQTWYDNLLNINTESTISASESIDYIVNNLKDIILHNKIKILQ